jgi:dTMP kinase
MLVTLEGLDGSGKTTAWEALRSDPPPALAASGGASDGAIDPVFTREPTDTWYGEAVERSIADADADPLAELFLYTADHAAHLAETIRPALRAGRPVIADRYVDSRYAYQGATLADDGRIDDAVAFVRDLHDPWSRPPDWTVYLDIDPETAAERSGGRNKFERSAYLDRVRSNYERLIDEAPERFVRIDATRPRDAVIAAVREAVDGAFATD